MQISIMLSAFLLPGALVAYWVVSDWMKERMLRRRWVTQPLLSDAFKRPGARVVRGRQEVME